MYCRGWCIRHYQRFQRWGDPQGGRRDVLVISHRDELGRKECQRCLRWLDVDCFDKRPEDYTDGYRQRCRRCVADDKRGLTQEHRDELLKAQNGSCKCKKLVFDIYGGRNVTYNIDHKHKCCPGYKSCGKCIRGLLCNGCNVILGHAADDPAVLQILGDYLNESDSV